MSDYLDRLARLVSRTRFADLSETAIAAAKAVALDTLGAILAGSRLDENRRLARVATARSGMRSATLIGHAEKGEPMLAALVNGTAGVALEVDEGNRFGGGHPAIHVLPAALAVGEEIGIDGPRFIESLVAGYEVTSRLGAATETRANVHSHGTWGTVGAAVAVARLLDREEPQIRAVINLAASVSPANSWIPCFEGATIRNLYPGRAGLQGILAVHLLDCGYTGLEDAPSDVYGTILGESFDPAAAVEGLGPDDRPQVFRIEQSYFKFHACCLYNHPALDAIQAIVREEAIAPDAVARIVVTSVPFVARMADPEPRTMLAAKFSVPYAVAAAVVTGRTDPAAFLDAWREDPRVRDIARRVEVSGDPAMSMRRSDAPTARVSISLKDGRVFTRETTVVRGDALNPAPREALVGKFMALADATFGSARCRQVVEAIDQIEEVKDVRDLTGLLVHDSAGGGAACSTS